MRVSDQVMVMSSPAGKPVPITAVLAGVDSEAGLSVSTGVADGLGGSGFLLTVMKRVLLTVKPAVSVT